MTTIAQNPSLLSNLSSKTTIITGGANGIGAETVRLFHSHGANIVIADLPQCAPSAETLIATLSPRVVFIPTDILNWSSMSELFSQTKQKFGSIDVVVANAGMMETKHFFDFEGEVDENGELKEPKEAYRVIDVNLKGTMNSTYRSANSSLPGNV
jgi:NAD(P)-dependent dehydrogenase (short-subunit alcohol dehydrogenase family)